MQIISAILKFYYKKLISPVAYAYATEPHLYQVHHDAKAALQEELLCSFLLSMFLKVHSPVCSSEI